MTSSTPSGTDLSTPSPSGADRFVDRHIGPRASHQGEMLARLGHESLDALMEAAVPEGIRSAEMLGLPGAQSEQDALGRLRELSERNNPGIAMIGLGYHPTITPPVIRRNVLEDPSWYTAYTPYQPEISQGRLEALLNFQTMVSDLTGLP
ncbi:MAG: glycine dehydrogenase (aminomethyl-transferring), partial [Actinomycetales bacterium]